MVCSKIVQPYTFCASGLWKQVDQAFRHDIVWAHHPHCYLMSSLLANSLTACVYTSGVCTSPGKPRIQWLVVL